jgi:hypothetical protein
MPSQSTLIFSRNWSHDGAEVSFVTRSVAGAATRFGDVTIVIPGPSGMEVADGAFDLIAIGGHETAWPAPDEAHVVETFASCTTVVVDELDDTVRLLLDRFDLMTQALHVVSPNGQVRRGSTLPFLPDPLGHAGSLGLHVPVNPLAAAHRHNGLGFTGYLLVLTDRPGTPPIAPPPDLAAWITAALHDQNVVVVEGGSAAVWQGRALRGIVPVETRTDLWRLLAHARVTIDLSPGPIVGRECIESLRFGTPIVVPGSSRASAHAALGAGLSFSSVSELISCLDQLRDDSFLAELQEEASRYSETWYGDPDRFVANLKSALA